MSDPSKHLFCFGLGFSGQALAKLALSKGWRVSGTVRSEEKAERLKKAGINALVLDAAEATALSDPIRAALAETTHLLQSIGTAKAGNDPLLPLIQPLAPSLQAQWAGYLSTTVVYGDWDGAWVDEMSEARSQSRRGLARLEAEAAWNDLGLPLHVFRLAGIYGPGRNALETVRQGRARIIDKPGQVFSRIHVEDIASSVFASMEKPTAAVGQPEVFNVCDDLPCAPGEVIEHACAMLDAEPPTPMKLEDAGLSEMGKSFYADNKRVSNQKLKDVFGWQPAFPTYREGLAAIFASSAFSAR